MKKKTEEVEKLKIELKSIKEFLSLQEKVAEIGGNCNKGNSENSSKSELEEHKISYHNINDKSDNSECKNKDTKLRTPTSKTDIDICTEKGAKRYEQEYTSEEEFNCLQCCFQGTSSSELRKHIIVKHMINCTDCDFYCNNKRDFENHKLLIHAKNCIRCRICGESFDHKSSMMNHRKIKHIQTVANCAKKINGECRFSSQKCWWNHEFNLEIENKSEDQFKCFTCNETFNSKGRMMLHKKEKHGHLVRSCIDHIDNKCTFNDKSCWFRHDEAFLEQTKEDSIKDDKEEDETKQISVFRQVLENLEPPIKT